MTTILWSILAVAYILFVATYFLLLYVGWKKHRAARAMFKAWQNRVTDAAPRSRPGIHPGGNGEK